MKVNLLIDDPQGVRSGYLNLDPLAPEGDPSRIKGDIFDLSHSVDAGEVSELVALDVLDYASSSQVDTVLDNWLSRLAHGGTLTLSVVDIREVARLFLRGDLDFDATQALIHGDQKKGWDFRKMILTLPALVTVLENKGYQVVSQRLDNAHALLTCRRP